jgi:hypothetical protein
MVQQNISQVVVGAVTAGQTGHIIPCFVADKKLKARGGVKRIVSVRQRPTRVLADRRQREAVLRIAHRG